LPGMRPGLGLRNGGAGRGAEPLRLVRSHLPGPLAAPAPCCAHRVAAAPPVARRGRRDGFGARDVVAEAARGRMKDDRLGVERANHVILHTFTLWPWRRIILPRSSFILVVRAVA